MPPTNLGPAPITEGIMPPMEIAMQQNAHKEHVRRCNEHKVVNKEVKQLETGAFEEKYLRHLKSSYAGFINMSIHQIFEHLHATYGNITNLDLKQNEERMRQHWNQENSIETTFQ